MRLSARCASAALILLIPLVATQGAAADGPSGRAVPAPLHRTAAAVPGEYIVTVDKALDPARVAARVGGVEPLHTYRHALNGFSARLDAAQLEQVRALPGVETVEENGVVSAPDATTTPASKHREAATSWGLDRIDQQTWDPVNGKGDGEFNVKGDGAGVTAYLIGTGIEYGHDEFEGRATLGTDTIGDGKDGADCQGQGTHVAGTVGGKTYGIARKVNLVSVRVLGCDGTGTFEQLIAGIDWVTANAKKPAIANLSLGGDRNEALDKAATALSDSGVLPVVAGGNSSKDACFISPAAAPRVLTVGASNKWDEETSFSNFGPCLSLYAPGDGITSAKLGGGSATLDGSSFSAPHVTGTAALYLAAHPDATPSDINEWLDTEATKDVLTNITKSSPNALLYTAGL
ncbi:S8 family peptidase [Kitasatospora sp. NPDC052868]|uniref:S8 family peptidase n=1 Tax=Kitasatospora sp. NPDC052868 TaxID=3364060 RepID=UPI0037CC12AD